MRGVRRVLRSTGVNCLLDYIINNIRTNLRFLLVFNVSWVKSSTGLVYEAIASGHPFGAFIAYLASLVDFFNKV